MNAMHSLALVITPEHLSCYRREDGRWRPMPLEGALVATLDERADRQVEAIRDELHDRASIASARLSLLVDDAARARAHAVRLCTAALEAGLGRVDTWRLGLLAARAEVPGAPAQAQWCIEHLLPCLDDAGAGGPRHETELTALRAALDAARRETRELADLHAAALSRSEQMQVAQRDELAALRARLASQDPVPTEAAVRFMPLFFRHFWEKFSPSDMAHVLRSSEMPVVPSPFMEPGGAALATLRRQFLHQPEALRLRVLALARDLGVNWEVRPDMRDLLEEA